MSELKAVHAYILDEIEVVGSRSNGGEYYLKSEADKVIAELEEKLKNSRNARKYWRKEYLIEYKECLHHKYKRCMAMERIAKDDWHLHNSFYAMGHREFEKRKCEFYEKWHKRWLKLDEKFKTN